MAVNPLPVEPLSGTEVKDAKWQLLPWPVAQKLFSQIGITSPIAVWRSLKNDSKGKNKPKHTQKLMTELENKIVSWKSELNCATSILYMYLGFHLLQMVELLILLF